MFALLFSRADQVALRRIQHPSYRPLALKRFGIALEHARVRNGLAYVHLGLLPADQEHIVAQLAEFCLGMAGAEISAVSGVFAGKFAMSLRSLSPNARLGEKIRKRFGEFGSAGGHPMMAKTVVAASCVAEGARVQESGRARAQHSARARQGAGREADDRRRSRRASAADRACPRAPGMRRAANLKQNLASDAVRQVHKRIVICADGTWNSTKATADGRHRCGHERVAHISAREAVRERQHAAARVLPSGRGHRRLH